MHSSTVFHYFRIFLKTSKQGVLFKEGAPVEMLKKTLTQQHKYDGPRMTNYIYHFLMEDNNFISAQIGRKRSIPLVEDSPSQFIEKSTESFPFVKAIFNFDVKNKKMGQVIAIESRKDLFRSELSVIQGLVNHLNSKLLPKHVSITVEPLTKPVEFWNFVDKYKGEMKELSFTLHRPNFFGSTVEFNDEMNKLKEAYNIEDLDVRFKSAAGQLTLNRNDGFLEKILEYVSKGGGSYTLKADKIKISSHDEGKARVVKEIDGLEVSTDNKEDFKVLCEKLFDNADEG